MGPSRNNQRDFDAVVSGFLFSVCVYFLFPSTPPPPEGTAVHLLDGTTRPHLFVDSRLTFCFPLVCMQLRSTVLSSKRHDTLRSLRCLTDHFSSASLMYIFCKSALSSLFVLPQINCVTFPLPGEGPEQQLLKPDEWSYCDYFWVSSAATGKIFLVIF